MATYDLTSSIPSSIKTGDILNCPYSGTYKQITLPKGTYKLEVWGAQGGTYSNTSNNNGGYSKGIITLNNKQTFYIYVGGRGNSNITHSVAVGGWNGGGAGTSDGSGNNTHCVASSGGGGTDISIFGGQCSLDNNSRYIRPESSYKGRLIVAGGGGGNSYSWAGGVGGGENGTAAQVASSSSFNGSGKCYASQTAAGGVGSWCQDRGTLGGFGYASSSLGSSQPGVMEGGGGGWYGGGASVEGGGGGSGYVYTASTATNYPSGCLLNSSYYLTDAQTISGNIPFTSPSGSSETGHTGDGYCRITVIEAKTNVSFYIKINNTWKECEDIYVKSQGEWLKKKASKLNDNSSSDSGGGGGNHHTGGDTN